MAGLARDVVDEIYRLWHEDADHLREEFIEKQPLAKQQMRYKSLFEGNYTAPTAPERMNGPADLDGVTRLFYSRGWTDGLPIIPPTPARYEKMLSGTNLDVNQLLSLLEPRQGKATVG